MVAAISALKVELAKCRTFKSEPVLEEFIPLKKEESEKEEKCREKNDWGSSFQLWNSDDDEACNRSNAYRLEQKPKKVVTEIVICEVGALKIMNLILFGFCYLTTMAD